MPTAMAWHTIRAVVKMNAFYGPGDKAGDLQRNGKRYEMRNLDGDGLQRRASVLTRCTNTFHSPSPPMTLASACFMTTSAAAG